MTRVPLPVGCADAPWLANASFNPERGQFVWDATSLSIFMECPRKYYYSQIWGWTRGRESSPHLFFGGLFAEAMELNESLIRGQIDLEERLDQLVDFALRSTWITDPEKQAKDPLGNPLGPVPGPWVSDVPKKTRETLLLALIWYVLEWDSHEMETLVIDGKPATEVNFKLEIANGIFYAGHLDRAAVWNGEAYVMDQKTTSLTPDARYWNQFELDNQMMGYAFCGQAVFGTPISGVIIDAISMGAASASFYRRPVQFTHENLEDWHTSALEHIEDAQLNWQYMNGPNDPENWPQRFTACTGKYSPCQFFKVCRASRSVRNNVLRGNFTQTLWNPSESR